MPRYRRFKRKRRSRRGRSKRRRRSYRPSLSSGRVMNLPGQRVVKHAYSQIITVTSTSGVFGEHRFACNDMFDPDITTTGHQPMGFDQMALQYEHYVVLGSKINVSWTQDTSSTAPGLCGTYVRGAAGTASASSDDLIEHRRGTWAIIQPNVTYAPKTRAKYSAKRFFNVKDVKDNLDRLGAAVTASPPELAHFVIWLQMFLSTTDTRTCLVNIEYITLYSEPKEVIGS